MSDRDSGGRSKRYDFEPCIARPVAGVAIAEQLEDLPVLGGSDNDLYELLKRLAVSHGEIVEDRDKHTAGVLGTMGAIGLRKQFYIRRTDPNSANITEVRGNKPSLVACEAGELRLMH